MEKDNTLLVPEVTEPKEKIPEITTKEATIKEPDHFTGKLSNTSNEIEEIISNKLPFIVQWGTVFIFLILLLLTIVCWFIKYPDIVSASAKLNSVHGPQEVIARTSSKLVQITVKENQKVKVAQVLGYMESIANPEAVMEINKQLDSISGLMNQQKVDEVGNFFPDYTNEQRLNELGELQSSYQTFTQSFISFRDFISKGFYVQKKKMLDIDVQNIQKLHKILIKQKQLMLEDLSLSNLTFGVNKSLVKDKVISLLDYRHEKSKLIAKQLSLPQINTAIVLNESQQNEKRKEIAELENQYKVQKYKFIQALRTMKSEVQSWEYKYLLKAPVSGLVIYSGFLEENQEMKAGQSVFNVQPKNASYFVQMVIPQYNFGKVKPGQRVLLKFKAYPFEQFGSVKGQIEHINSLPSDSGYLAKVVLPEGLITDRKIKLKFQHGLLAQADIVTEDMRLLERFYFNLTKNL